MEILFFYSRIYLKKIKFIEENNLLYDRLFGWPIFYFIFLFYFLLIFYFISLFI